MRMPSVGADTAPLAGVIERTRLSRILDASMNRLCVVEGPSGTGKTTLLRTWALRHADDTLIAWIPVGAGIGSRRAFWEHVVTTTRRAGTLPENAARRIHALLDVSADPVDLASELLSAAGPLTIVLDAYEQLGEVLEEVDRDLARIIQEVPNVRLLISTRGRTSLTELEWSGTHGTRVITMSDLAFTVDEVAGLLTDQVGLEDEHLARSIVRSTRGLALTVRAATLALARLGRIPDVGSIDWDAVMAAKLEAQLPDEAAISFLTRTSVPPYVDLELARRLTGHPDAARTLDLLERNGFGRWIPFARERPVFQYVDSIRETFRSRAAEDDDTFARSSVIAAEWLRANDDVDQALLFAIEGQDYALADRIYVQILTTKPESYVTSRYLPLLRTIPQELLPEYPMLAFGLGLAFTANALLRSEAPRFLRIAAESSARPAYIDPAVDALSHAAMRVVARRLAHDFRSSSHAAREALDLVDAIDSALYPQIGDHVGTVLRQISYSLLQGGMSPEALTAMTRSVALSSTQAVRNYSITYAAGTAAFMGDLNQARSHLASIDRDAWPEDLRKSYMTGLGLVAEAYLLLDALDFDVAIDLLRDVDVYMPQAEFWPFYTAVSVSARHGVGQGAAEAARVMAALAAPVPPPGVGENVATEHLRAMLAHTLIADGDARAAARLVDGTSPESPYLASARIALLVARETSHPVGRRAHELLELPGHTLRTRAATQTFAAVAALREGRPEDAWRLLSAASVVSESYGPRSHVSALPSRDRILLLEFARSRGSVSLQRYLDVPSRAIHEISRPTVALTPRESTVLTAFAEHGSVRQVAEALVVSPHTVKSQLQGIYRKLGVSSRQSALSTARELGLLEPTE